MRFIEITDADGNELLVNAERVEEVRIVGYRVCIRYFSGKTLEINVNDDGYGQVRAILFPSEA